MPKLVTKKIIQIINQKMRCKICKFFVKSNILSKFSSWRARTQKVSTNDQKRTNMGPKEIKRETKASKMEPKTPNMCQKQHRPMERPMVEKALQGDERRVRFAADGSLQIHMKINIVE